MRMRTIPGSGEALPVIGLGTWQTFDVGPGDAERAPLARVLRDLGAAGGRVVDTSPMYGRAEEALGALLHELPRPFVATKVWTRGRSAGVAQMQRSLELLRTSPIDLMQVHNVVDWRVHLDTLAGWKRDGLVRYVGVTHYTTSAFDDLEQIMRSVAIDFVQLPYSAGVPDAEERLLPLAKDRGIAVLVNRPFEEGGLFRRLRQRALPAWAGESSWAELLIRWIVSNDAVTCVIPATSDARHLAENLAGGDGPLLDECQRDEVRRLAS
jgi:diketogulonate reductase-like aldo/keto reductase